MVVQQSLAVYFWLQACWAPLRKLFAVLHVGKWEGFRAGHREWDRAEDLLLFQYSLCRCESSSWQRLGIAAIQLSCLGQLCACASPVSMMHHKHHSLLSPPISDQPQVFGSGIFARGHVVRACGQHRVCNHRHHVHTNAQGSQMKHINRFMHTCEGIGGSAAFHASSAQKSMSIALRAIL